MIVRPGRADDAPALAVILRTCFRVNLPFLPELHTAEEDLAFMAGRIAGGDPVWTAEVGGVAVGYIILREGWVDHLFIHPDHQGQGIGRQLLAKALEQGGPIQLWTFQQNERARRFYEAHGFEAAEFTDGEDNEEKTPDVRYVWTPRGL